MIFIIYVYRINIFRFLGDWISRTILKRWQKEKNDQGEEWPINKGGKERGKDYNHSTFCDLIINGLIGKLLSVFLFSSFGLIISLFNFLLLTFEHQNRFCSSFNRKFF